MSEKTKTSPLLDTIQKDLETGVYSRSPPLIFNNQERPAGLNKYHMSSYGFAEHLPRQIEWAQVMSNDTDVPIYITTNVDNDASGKMLRVNKIFNILEKQKIVDFVGEEDVYYTKQNIWKLNKKEYYGHRYKTPKKN